MLTRHPALRRFAPSSFKDAIELAKRGQFDAYVAVGGGSVMDTCKAANLYASHPEADFLDFVNAPIGKGKAVTKPLKPLFAGPQPRPRRTRAGARSHANDAGSVRFGGWVCLQCQQRPVAWRARLLRPSPCARPNSPPPHLALFSLAGTGSETTGTAIFDFKALGAKTGITSRAIKPYLGLIDPDNTQTMPRAVRAASGLDVLWSVACLGTPTRGNSCPPSPR